MEIFVDAKPKAKAFIESMLPSMMEQLKISKSKKYLYVMVDSMGSMGQAIPLMGIDTYLIVLHPTKDMASLGSTLAHELVHVAQMITGKLKITPKGRKWNGKFYKSDYPYLSQPWELEAFAKQEIIFRRAID